MALFRIQISISANSKFILSEEILSRATFWRWDSQLTIEESHLGSTDEKSRMIF